jgi:outer membrane lipoprotein-sorting protein
MNLGEDSRLLQAPNGYNALKSDLANLLAKLNDSLTNGNKARVTVQPVNVPRLQQNVYVLQVYKPSPNGDVICEQLYIDASSNIPVEWDLFKNGVRYSVVIFENFKGNIGLDDSQFQI